MLIFLRLVAAIVDSSDSYSIVMVRNIILAESGRLNCDLLQRIECFGSNNKTCTMVPMYLLCD